MQRRQTLELLAERIASLCPPHPLRVAIDGIDAAGKTTLADELVDPIQAHGRPVIRASIDGFHRPRAQRYRQRDDPARGYYEDSFDCVALRRELLLPLGPSGSRLYRRAIFDHRTDTLLPVWGERAPENAVLLFDGIFLSRPGLDGLWDYRVFVEVTFETALQRALVRDQPVLGSPREIEARYRCRYFPAQQLYLQSVRPRDRADVVIDNEIPECARFRLPEPQAVT